MLAGKRMLSNIEQFRKRIIARPAGLDQIIHPTREANDRVSIEAKPCRSEGISAKWFIVILGARQYV
jgi:hypothetical protein